MQPSYIPEQQSAPKRHIILKIVIAVVLVSIAAFIAIVVLKGIHHSSLENGVKTELIKQNTLIKGSVKKGVYPATFPKDVGTTGKVSINATIGLSGTNYCIEAMSKSDTSIVFHMSKDTPKDTPDAGTCFDNVTQPPLMPADFAVGSVGAGAINLTWSKAPFAATYTVQCAKDAAFVNDLKSQMASEAMISFDGLDGGVLYYCRIAATNNVGQSAWSDTVTAMTTVVSLKPQNVKAVTQSSSEISYAWDPVAGATSYVLEYSPDVNFVTDVVKLTTTSTSGVAMNLKADTEYNFHVKAVTAGFDAAHATFSDVQSTRTTK